MPLKGTQAPTVTKAAGAPVKGRYRARPVSRGPFWPTVSRRVTQGPLAGHNALDIGANIGDPVFAPVGGVITSVVNSRTGYGLSIRQLTADGRELIFGHLSAVGVRIGQRVNAGQTIGAVGSTGQSTGPHLHFEVRQPGPDVFAGGTATTSALDPYSLFGLGAANAPRGSNVRLVSGTPGYRTSTMLQETAEGKPAGQTWIQQAAAKAGEPSDSPILQYIASRWVRIITMTVGLGLVFIAAAKIASGNPAVRRVASAAVNEIPGAGVVRAAVGR